MTMFAGHSYAFHIFMHCFRYFILVIRQNKCIAIINVPLFHLFLSILYTVIVSWRFEFYAEAHKVFIRVEYHQVWLAFHIALFMSPVSCLQCPVVPRDLLLIYYQDRIFLSCLRLYNGGQPCC